ncbi:hypothetical protein OGAPHI_002996 [Ogataea philodendri]|uniref:Iron permease FTR1 n=1 Tax=Ogataea philodendri TaxID=1378263 RepID=A0A9P8P9N9_9ASCO|nr:uncharacterized protein OGAPHI_002996 [Ogataea philodendri]KAH3667347.1 hypothetical protein OGAPHI_002996 [Ogataea philodendri]
MWEDYFSVQIFFIILRETLESAIIVSVLLSFLKQNFATEAKNSTPSALYRGLVLQVWVGAISGLAICLCLGAIFIAVFYLLGSDVWSKAERVWEGVFSIISAILIAVMGMALLRVNQLQTKWKWKLGAALSENNTDTQIEADVRDDPMADTITRAVKVRTKLRRFARKYALGLLPFVTTLREGLEAVVFVGGIGINQPVSSFPLAIITGAISGTLIGYVLYKGGNRMSLQFFLVLATCFLYLVAAGLMSRGVWFLELEQFVQKCGQDTSETGSGPGSYDISKSVWHVNCCNGLTDGGWMLLNALFGWTNSATYGSVWSYILFWGFVIVLLKNREARITKGYLPWFPVRYQIKHLKKRIAIERIYLEDIALGNADINAAPNHEGTERTTLLQNPGN